MPFKQHCFKGEGVLYFIYSENYRKCSKTFGRHCRLFAATDSKILSPSLFRTPNPNFPLLLPYPSNPSPVFPFKSARSYTLSGNGIFSMTSPINFQKCSFTSSSDPTCRLGKLLFSIADVIVLVFLYHVETSQ